jgi:hypothetical protein
MAAICASFPAPELGNPHAAGIVGGACPMRPDLPVEAHRACEIGLASPVRQKSHQATGAEREATGFIPEPASDPADVAPIFLKFLGYLPQMA